MKRKKKTEKKYEEQLEEMQKLIIGVTKVGVTLGLGRAVIKGFK